MLEGAWRAGDWTGNRYYAVRAAGFPWRIPEWRGEAPRGAIETVERAEAKLREHGAPVSVDGEPFLQRSLGGRVMLQGREAIPCRQLEGAGTEGYGVNEHYARIVARVTPGADWRFANHEGAILGRFTASGDCVAVLMPVPRREAGF